ncbi:hypothetical protein Vadar_013057 [Vaccinium darrowii]|uniref:Uncharacterized protein n=1 Tax=Vaccinium darrowii TaxID=229202 RepID=A0ACB7XRL3_9ERIC|nr:hypothetical protein Vadar_013057 [Vaccinium darrowii]
MEQLLPDGPPDLPSDVIYQILLRLPIKPLCRFQSVSKHWFALITDCISSNNIESSTTQKLIIASCSSRSVYSLDYQAPDQTVAKLEKPYKSGVRIVGSCNGVVLLHVDAELCLWNPSTRTYLKFSQPKNPYGYAIHGLGYDSVSDDFKVVRIVRPSNDAPCAVHVFTSKLRSWKRIEDFGHCIFRDRWGSNVLNGAPHWVLSRSTDKNAFSANSTTMIVCFDATAEKFKDVPKPNYEGLLAAVALEGTANQMEMEEKVNMPRALTNLGIARFCGTYFDATKNDDPCPCWEGNQSSSSFVLLLSAYQPDCAF